MDYQESNDDKDFQNGDVYTIDDMTDEIYDADVDDNDEDQNSNDDGQYDTSQFVFSKHEGSVFVISIDKEDKYVVSGGEDDKAYLWELKTGNILFEIHCKDSVVCASFNSTSSLVGVGDMSGLIKVFDIAEKKEIWCFETSDLEWLQWHPVASILLAGTTDGDAWLWKIPSGDSKTFSSPGCACTCGKFLPDGKTAALCYSDGSIRLHDLKSKEILHTLKKDGHRASVNHVICTDDGQTLISGAADGVTLLTNIPSGKVYAVYRENKNENRDDTNFSIEYLSYSKSMAYIAGASLDSYLYIWDMKSGTLRTKCQHPSGLTRLVWDSEGLTVFTGCLDGICRRWDARSGELLNTYVGHSDDILDLLVTKNDQYLLSASSDGTVRVYDVEDANALSTR